MIRVLRHLEAIWSQNYQIVFSLFLKSRIVDLGIVLASLKFYVASKIHSSSLLCKQSLSLVIGYMYML